MPISLLTSICVFPWQNRSASMLRCRGSNRAMASFSAMRSSQLSSVFFSSRTWSMTHTVSPLSAYSGSYKLTGSLNASMANTTSSRGMSRYRASCSTVGSRCVSASSASRARRIL